MDKMRKSDVALLGLIVLSVVAVIGATAWHFLVVKSYTFVVEAQCDPATETCFYRDCSIEFECPPNELSDYKIYNIHALDYPKCDGGSCRQLCESGEIECTETVCSESEGDVCSELPPPMEEDQTES